jgi:hypothetical protein
MVTRPGPKSIPIERDPLNFSLAAHAAKICQRRVAIAAYCRAMLGLQDTRGEPGLRTRVLAALVILGLVVFTAPLVVIPVISWLLRQI